MSLDLFADSIRASDQEVMANAAANLPAGFGESFDIATRSLAEWHNWGAYKNAQERALSTYYDDVKQKTGVQLPLYGMGGNVSLDELNGAIAKLPQQAGETEPSFTPLSEGSINAMALQRMKMAHDDAAAFSNRETTWGGTAGTIAGTLIGGLSDPVNLATMALGGAGELGIAMRALEFAAISGGTEAATAASNYSDREAAVPGSSKEIPGEIAGAAGAGAVLGGAFGVLGKLLGHGAKPLPTSVRDEVNAATSEFQFHATNPFPTAAGETAARDATVEATTSLAKGETVTAADNFAASHVADYALAAKAATPEELAIAGERHLRPETFDQVPDVERFDAMPHAADDTASYWDRRIAQASPEERAALGATDVAGAEKRASESRNATAGPSGFPDHEYSVTGYHGSNDVIGQFDPKKTRLDRGVFFSDTPELANKFAHGLAVDGDAAHFPDEPGFLDWIKPLVSDKEFKSIAERHAQHDAAMLEMDKHEPGSAAYSKAQDLYTEISRDLNNEAKKVTAYLDHESGNYSKSPNVTPVKLRLGKTHEVDMGGKFDWDVERAAIDFAEKNGFDSVTLKNYGEGADRKIFSILDAENIRPRFAPEAIAARDLTPAEVTKLAADPATESAVLHNLEHIMAEKPDMEFSTQVRQADGSYHLTTQKLSDVLAELDGMEAAGKELEACAAGLALAAE